MEKETLEEAAKKIYPTHKGLTTIASNKIMLRRTAFIKGAKWQAERMYSEANKIMKFLNTEKELKLSDAKTIERIKWYFETYFEQFKKK
jgi:hypothetical protein